MPEVVEAGIGRKTGVLEKPGKEAVSKVGGVDKIAYLACEDEASGPGEGAHPLPLFELLGEVGSQSLRGFPR